MRGPKHVVIYRGAPNPKKVQREPELLDENGMRCPECDARVQVIHSKKFGTRPRAHAPGGFRPNMRRGLFKCEGSGNDGG